MASFRSSSVLQRAAGILLTGMISCGDLTAQGAADAEDIRGPKPPVEIPVPAEQPVALWIALGCGLLALILAGILWRYYTGRQRMKNPREIALASLGEIEAKQESVPAEAFAYRTAKAVRDYLAAGFGFTAPRRTTEEFLRDLAAGNHPALAGDSSHLAAFLKSCDLAKFAGSQLDVNQRAELIETARTLIRQTDAAARATGGAKP